MDDLNCSGWISVFLKLLGKITPKSLAFTICLGSKIERLIVEINIWQSTALVEPHMISMERLIGLAGTVVRPILCPAPHHHITEQHIVLHLSNVVLAHTSSGELQLEYIATAPALFIPQCNSMFAAASTRLQWAMKSCWERGSETAQNKRIAIKRPVKANFSQSTQYSKKKKCASLLRRL